MIQALEEGAEVVTASRRLARTLRERFDEIQVRQGRQAWRSPVILPLEAWLARTAQRASASLELPPQVDSVSAFVLWDECFRRHAPAAMPNPGGVARQAYSALQRAGEWRLPPAEISKAARNLDEIVFSRALSDYRQRLSRDGWTDASGRLSLLSDRLVAAAARLPERILFAGFERLSPSVEALLAALSAAGVAAERIRPDRRNSAVEFATFEFQEQEWRAAGAWARERLEAKPSCRLAIVCPALDSQAAVALAAIREGLTPGWQYGGAAWRDSVNVAYGRRLSEHPAVSGALLFLRWAVSGLSTREISMLLRSRCFGQAPLNGRYRLETALRKLSDRRWSAGDLRQALLGVDKQPDSLEFLGFTDGVAELAGDLDTLRTPAEQADRIDKFLKGLHWPGGQSLSSAEFQLVNRWRELLNEVARVESIISSISMSRMIAWVNRLATDTLWQPESSRAPAVQLLGVNEAAGLEFDGIWIAGMDASRWPAPTRASPFIAREIQQRYDMPDASPEATLAFARQVLEGLVSSATDCVISWSRTQDDAELTASPLLDAIPAREYHGQVDPGRFLASLSGDNLYPVDAGDKAPPVVDAERISGGAYTVQRQMTEPLAAFVHGRLGYRPLERIIYGLSAGVRGSIIHDALHSLLGERPTQQQIGDWDAEQLDRRVGTAVDTALAPHLRHADALLRSLVSLERQRLRDLLFQFVAAELGREPFTVVAVEHELEYCAEGIRLGLRIDRMDRLADGRLAIIDYKTGAARSFLNREGDPSDWQLVVYADAAEEPIGALVLCNIDTRAISARGVGGEWTALEDWDATLLRWRSVVHKSLAQIAAGDVRINLRQAAADGRSLALLSRLEEYRRDH